MEDPKRFPDPRQAGAFLGMTPRRDQSGEVDKQRTQREEADPV
jgi:transposase